MRVDGTTETNILGETNPTYTLVDADAGKTIKVRASFTDDAGFDEARISVATATVTTATVPPTIVSVAVSSSPVAAPDTYGRDETIRLTATFDKAVAVTGTPRIEIRMGSSGVAAESKWAQYDSGSGSVRPGSRAMTGAA